MARYYWIETYGCQMNKAETNALINRMAELGWFPSPSAEEAEMVILNTCSVRATAESRVRGRIGFYKTLKKKRPHTLVLMGCMAERLKDTIRKEEPAVDLVVGTFQKDSFLSFLKGIGNNEKAPFNLENATHYRFASSHYQEKEFKAFVPIMHGCDNFCSYCIVPHVRGREVSRAPAEIFQELTLLSEKGVREITLLGQNVNSYRFEQGGTRYDFPTLLEEIVRRFPGLPWIRFLTSHPKDLSHRLIEAFARFPQLCKHLHLPVQHGSNTILERMNRGYTREAYLRLVQQLREAVPSISLTTDILIGFPGEREKDFEETLDLLETVRFDDAFTYYYNPREGTQAYSFPDDVPMEIKRDRLDQVIQLQRRIGKENKATRIGSKVKVLVEEVSKMKSTELLARTERDEMVVIPGPRDWIGTFVEVELISLRGNTFRGKKV